MYYKKAFLLFGEFLQDYWFLYGLIEKTYFVSFGGACKPSRSRVVAQDQLVRIQVVVSSITMDPAESWTDLHHLLHDAGSSVPHTMREVVRSAIVQRYVNSKLKLSQTFFRSFQRFVQIFECLIFLELRDVTNFVIAKLYIVHRI